MQINYFIPTRHSLINFLLPFLQVLESAESGAACSLPQYHELAELILQSADVDDTKGPGDHAGHPAQCMLACTCSGVVCLLTYGVAHSLLNEQCSPDQDQCTPSLDPLSLPFPKLYYKLHLI